MNNKKTCEICGYIGTQNKFKKININPWGIDDKKTATICINCNEIIEKYGELIREYNKPTKKEADQA